VTPIPTPKLDPIADTAESPSPTPKSKVSTSPEAANGSTTKDYALSVNSDTDAASTKSRRSWFKKKSRHRSRSRHGSDKALTIASSSSTDISKRSDEDDVLAPLERTARDDEWRLGDDIRMQLDI
jgi:hypothetical protein